MNDIVLITPPVAEPVSLDDMLIQLGMGPISDDGLNNNLTRQLTRFIRGARRMCETYTRSVYVTQKWLLKRDGWPRNHTEYGHDFHDHAILLPKTPFQSLEFLQYVDETGMLQTLTQDASYGANPAAPLYGYQLDPGSETQPARLSPPWARPWPPIRLVPSNVLVQYKCGFGGPVKATMGINTNILTGPVFIPTDVGQDVVICGAGSGGIDLATTISSVDGNGQATLADNVTIAVTKATDIYVGDPVPEDILNAIMFLAQFFYEQGAVVDMALPRLVTNSLDPYRNLVS